MLSTLGKANSSYVCPHYGIINLRVGLGSLLPAVEPSVGESRGRRCQVSGALEWIETQRFGTQGAGSEGWGRREVFWGVQMARDTSLFTLPNGPEHI